MKCNTKFTNRNKYNKIIGIQNKVKAKICLKQMTVKKRKRDTRNKIRNKNG